MESGEREGRGRHAFWRKLADALWDRCCSWCCPWCCGEIITGILVLIVVLVIGLLNYFGVIHWPR